MTQQEIPLCQQSGSLHVDFSHHSSYYHDPAQPKMVERQQPSVLGSSDLTNSSPTWAAETWAECETCFHKEQGRFNMHVPVFLINFACILSSASLLVTDENENDLNQLIIQTKL